MRYRQFGKTAWCVSELGFGGARIGGLLAQDGGREASIRTLEAACDAGINFYDTADIYSQGESEVLIGKAFRRKRGKVFIASKGGYSLPGRKKLIQVVKPFAKPIARVLGLRRSSIPAALSGRLSQNFSPDYLRKAAEASLRRLQSDYIDLYQLHSPPLEELRGARLEEALGLLTRLKAEGKIREYGIALDSVEDVSSCLSLNDISSVQLPFGLMDLEALDGAFHELSARQLGIIARGCFGGGALKQSVSETELVQAEPKWQRVLQIKQIAGEMRRSPLEAALQFSLRNNSVSVNILGMRTPLHLAENLQHYSSSPLSDEEHQRLLRQT